MDLIKNHPLRFMGDKEKLQDVYHMNMMKNLDDNQSISRGEYGNWC